MKLSYSNLKNKAFNILGYIFTRSIGFIVMALLLFISYKLFTVKDLNFGIFVFILSAVMSAAMLRFKLPWYLPVLYSVIICVFLITKTASGEGISQDYFKVWYSHMEIMNLAGVALVCVPYAASLLIDKSKLLICSVTSLLLLSFGTVYITGLLSSNKQNDEILFGRARDMLIQNVLSVRTDIDAYLKENDDESLNLKTFKIDFSFGKSAQFVEELLPEEGSSREFSKFFTEFVYDYLYNYDKGVALGDYKEGQNDRLRLIKVRDYCLKFAGDLANAYNDFSKKILNKAFSKFYSAFFESSKNIVQNIPAPTHTALIAILNKRFSFILARLGYIPSFTSVKTAPVIKPATA